MKRTFLIVVGLASAAFAQLDPRIPMQVKPPQIDNPLDTYRRALEIKNQQAEIEIRRAEAERIRSETEASRQRNSPPINPAQQPPSGGDVRTFSLLNCRAWGGWAETLRLAYLNGGIELLGSFAVTTSADNPEKAAALIKDFMPFSLTIPEMSSGVSRLCADAENARIPLVDALKLVAAKTNGLPPDQFESQVAFARKVAAAAPKQP